MKKTTITAILSLHLTMLSQAHATTPNQVPAELMYSGKPIDSLCFFNLESDSDIIDLAQCTADKNKYAFKGTNVNLSNKGFIGYDFLDQSTSPAMQGYSYYKFFDAGNKSYWLYTINGGGGSGEFTSIFLSQRKNPNQLTIKNVAGGDRCNGGVQDVSSANQTLTYSVNLTAYDFITLSNTKLPNVKAYDDLAACAACCIAKSFYDVDSSLQPKLTYVDLGTVSNADEMPGQGSLQDCFNKLFASRVAKKETKLTQEKLNDFVAEFNKTCVK